MKRVIPILAVAAIAGAAVIYYRYIRVPKASVEELSSELSAVFDSRGTDALSGSGSMPRPVDTCETATAC